MQEITNIITAADTAYQALRASDAPDEVKATAGRHLRLLVADLSGLNWSVENCPERWS
ncbi:hypothetical protein AB0878_48920 [Amycolatopsis sp. NPDC047767]|uniref:hypothetical protein n=1 Tax=Amycolatopsis sp. NPDC047767 TaxID=3156765 RepID=UPI00345641CA